MNFVQSVILLIGEGKKKTKGTTHHKKKFNIFFVNFCLLFFLYYAFQASYSQTCPSSLTEAYLRVSFLDYATPCFGTIPNLGKLFFVYEMA